MLNFFLDPRVLGAALGIWIGFYFVLRPTLQDLCRERLFEIRDRIFDDAAEGRVSFEEPAYGMLRMELNAAIYSVHILTLPHILLGLLARRWLPRIGDGGPFDLPGRLSARLQQIGDSDPGKILVGARRQAAALCAAYFFSSSLLFWSLALALLVVLVPIAVVSALVKTIGQQCRETVETVGERWIEIACDVRGADERSAGGLGNVAGAPGTA